MAVIQVNNLSKDFKVKVKEKGLKGILKSLTAKCFENFFHCVFNNFFN